MVTKWNFAEIHIAFILNILQAVNGLYITSYTNILLNRVESVYDGHISDATWYDSERFSMGEKML